MTITIKKVIRTGQWIVFIFVWKRFKRVELKEKLMLLNTIGLLQEK